MKLKRYISILLTLILTFSIPLTLSACDADDFAIYFGVESIPKNLDPQLASTESEFLAVRNCFRGLYKQSHDDNGVTVVPDLAESTTVSDDGLTYTFTLKASKWHNDKPVTAHDFVFAVKRVKELGDTAPGAKILDNLSETVANGDNTVIFSLFKPDKLFLSRLANAVFMPCNEEFFKNCKGKYGFGKSYILTNGNYKIASWAEKKTIRLSRTAERFTDDAEASVVYLTAGTSGKNNIERICAAEIGMTSDSKHSFSAVNTDKYSVKSEYLTTYALIFNGKSEIGANKLFTDAFAKSIDRDYYVSRLDTRFKAADSIIPDGAYIKSVKVNTAEIKAYYADYLPDESRKQYLEAIKSFKNGKMPELTVLCPDDDEINAVLTDVISSLQKNLGAYINIKTVANENELTDIMKTGNFTLAFVPFRGDAADILSAVATGSYSTVGTEVPQFSAVSAKALSSDDKTELMTAVNDAAAILSQRSDIIPVLSVPTAYIANSGYQNVYFSPVDGTVDFSIIYK